MEPLVATITIDQEIKFKKADLLAKRDKENAPIKSRYYRVCSISNAKYLLVIFPNGDMDERRGRALIFLFVDPGNAKSVETDVDCFIESVGFTMNIKRTFGIFDGRGDPICSTEKFFDESKKTFDIDEMAVKIKGIMKIILPPNKVFHPFSAEWKIKESDLKALNASKYERLCCKKFNISSNSDLKYFLKFYPNGDREEDRGTAWIFFHLRFPSTVSNVDVALSISIDSANFSCDVNFLIEKNVGTGLPICSTEDLFNPEKQYFVDGEMIIKVTGTLMVEKEIAANVEIPITEGSQANGEKDFTILVGEKSIKVHKQLLLDSSPYFVGMFNSGMIESTEMKTTITDFDYEIVEAGIQILYSPSNIPSKFTFEKMLELLRFSDKYAFQIIKNLLQDHLIANISPTNVCLLINFTSTTVSTPKLYSACIDFVIKCSEEKKALHGLETLDKDLILKIFKGTFIQKL